MSDNYLVVTATGLGYFHSDDVATPTTACPVVRATLACEFNLCRLAHSIMKNES